MGSDSGEVTRLLLEVENHKEEAVPRLFELLYDELRRIAQRHFSNERPDHSLQATALVHEAYARLVGAGCRWQNRAHFFGVASGVMRRILVDHARAKRAAKRPDSHQKISWEDVILISDNQLGSVIEIDEALSRLAAVAPRQARIIELRYFGGLTAEEVAEVLGISLNTVKRDLALAKAWLYAALRA